MENEKKHEEKRQENKIKQFKISKTVLYIIAAVIITFLVTSAAFTYIPKYQKSSELNSYKKQLYDSLLCQYSCPLIDQTYDNKTQLLPDQVCVQTCTASLKAEQAKGIKFTNEDLINDNLITDVEGIVKKCRTLTTTLKNTTIATIDNEKFFTCVKTDLESVKETYAYLK